MIGWLEAFVLGVVQGITEYLPVSSSGHLVIFQALFGMEDPMLLFDIVLHTGTLVAVVWFYRKELLASVADVTAGAKALAAGTSYKTLYQTNEGVRLWTLILFGTIPTGIIGVGFKDEFEALFGSPARTGAMLIVTGLILLATRYAKDEGRTEMRIRWWEAVAIGVVQGIAITPGISRSGSTIAAALLLGIDRATAARFSFLLSLPAITGALILKFEPEVNADPVSFAIGFFAAMIVGYLCLAFLVAIVKKGRLSWFAWYCFAAGAATMLFIK
ncbi:MAG: undecaprenyl-diphosphate phosphatase [Nitrospinae bacterium]|nr:undecaprenyl-diphosphate phosphatase [Nitrospinota bacterium]